MLSANYKYPSMEPFEKRSHSKFNIEKWSSLPLAVYKQ